MIKSHFVLALIVLLLSNTCLVCCETPVLTNASLCDALILPEAGFDLPPWWSNSSLSTTSVLEAVEHLSNKSAITLCFVPDKSYRRVNLPLSYHNDLGVTDNLTFVGFNGTAFLDDIWLSGLGVVEVPNNTRVFTMRDVSTGDSMIEWSGSIFLERAKLSGKIDFHVSVDFAWRAVVQAVSSRSSTRRNNWRLSHPLTAHVELAAAHPIALSTTCHDTV
jgi:hypothetical protein